MGEALCGACGVEPAHQGLLCGHCRADFARRVAHLGYLREELTAALVPGSTPPQIGGGAPVSPSAPLNLTASDLLRRLKDVERDLRGLLPATDRLSAPLSDRVDALVRLEGIGAVAVRLHRLYDDARELQEPEGERVGLGRCVRCGEEMFAARTSVGAVCEVCGTFVHVQAVLQSRAQARAADFAEVYLTPAQIQEATSGRVRADRVRQWVRRGKVEPDDQGRVRFGTVLDLAAPKPSTTTARAA